MIVVAPSSYPSETAHKCLMMGMRKASKVSRPAFTKGPRMLATYLP